MERDFMGLSNRKYMSEIKREINDDAVGGLSKDVALQWRKGKLVANSNLMSASDFQDATAFPWGSVSAANGFVRGQFSGAFQNMQPLLLGGSVPITTHSPLLPRVSSSGPYPQLTIFYNGTVSVFNDISQEKAQAIMSCARTGLKTETGLVKEAEKVYGKQIHNATAAAAASSSSATPENFSRCADKHVAVTNPMSLIDSFNAGPRSMIPSVPQARKASLARFLEKRKERLMSAMPYKKMLLDMSTGESCGMAYSSSSHT